MKFNLPNFFFLVGIGSLMGCGGPGATLRLNPVPISEGCQRRLDFDELEIDNIAVIPFAESDKSRSEKFTPPPPFDAQAFDVYVHLPDSGVAATAAAESTLINLPSVDVIERREVETLLEEQHWQMTGIVPTEKSVQVGKMLGAQALLMGKVNYAYGYLERVVDSQASRFLGAYTGVASIEMRVAHVESGKVLWACTLERNSLNYLEDPFSVNNRQLNNNVHIFDSPLHGATPEDRTQFVIRQIIQEALKMGSSP